MENFTLIFSKKLTLVVSFSSIVTGNVWFDFPEVNKLGCVSHRTIGNLQPPHLYDLSRFFDAKGHRVCLRLSQKGYWNRTGSVIT